MDVGTQPLAQPSTARPSLDTPLIEIAEPLGLLSAAQWNIIEFHTWNAVKTQIDTPDRITFDLGPDKGSRVVNNPGSSTIAAILWLSDWHKIFGQQSEADMKQNHNPRPLEETRRYWPIMTAYERFEQIVAFLLGLLIAVVVVIALIQLLIEVMPLLLGGALDPLDHRAFQALFGMIMTLLIAMEFKHSIIRVALRREGVIQVKTVMLVALLALSRKFIILDVAATESATIAALSGATLVLGIVYWLLRERDDRLASAVRDPQADVG